jgi:hypothetical protein
MLHAQSRVGATMSDPTTQAGVLNFAGQITSPIVAAIVAWFAGKWRGGGKFTSEIEAVKTTAFESQARCEAENHLLREASSMMVAAVKVLGNAKPAVLEYVHKVEHLLAQKVDQ